MQAVYALFFHHTLFTMYDVERSGIRFDTRKSYLCEVKKFLNIYVMNLGLGAEYGHKFVNISLDDLVQWDGVVQRDGVRG